MVMESHPGAVGDMGAEEMGESGQAGDAIAWELEFQEGEVLSRGHTGGVLRTLEAEVVSDIVSCAAGLLLRLALLL